jgi:hypothetical protein
MHSKLDWRRWLPRVGHLAFIDARSQLAGLTPLQIAVVMAIFIVTLCGALTAALAFRRWNELQKRKERASGRR